MCKAKPIASYYKHAFNYVFLIGIIQTIQNNSSNWAPLCDKGLDKHYRLGNYILGKLVI